MTDTETAQVQQIREREQQATKGPWGVRFDHDVTGYPCYFIRGVSGDGKRDVQSLAANARFIEGARTDIPFLLALLARQQAEIDRLRALNELLQRQLDASPFCPDCRDKVRGESCPRCRYQKAEAEIDRLRGERDEANQAWAAETRIVDGVVKAVKDGEGYHDEDLASIVADYVKRAESAESSLTDLREALTKLADEYELYLGGDALLDSVRALLASPHTPTEAR